MGRAVSDTMEGSSLKTEASPTALLSFSNAGNLRGETQRVPPAAEDSDSCLGMWKKWW